MSATLLNDVATATASAIHAAHISYNGNVLKVYDHEPQALDTLPAVTVDGPTAIRRRDPEQRESQLGSDDWHMTFTLRVYTHLDDPGEGASESRAILGQVIAALDADETLGGTADLGAAVANGTRERVHFVADESQQMLMYVCDLSVWALVP